MANIGRVTVDVDAEMHRELKIETIKRGTTLSDIVRAFLFAWLKRDRRAEQIVNEYHVDFPKK